MAETTGTAGMPAAPEMPEKPNWDVRWIMSVLPHRYPMLLIDRVLEMEPRQRIVAIKNFTINEEFFAGHFPQHPVVPGVLLVEAMAQAGGILLMHDDPEREKKLLLFMSIERARFRRPVVPGDRVHFEATGAAAQGEPLQAAGARAGRRRRSCARRSCSRPRSTGMSIR